MAFLKIEQETQISFNAAEDTADPVMIRKMNKLVEENPEQFKSKVHSRYKGEVYAMLYTLPKKFVVIRTKERRNTMTEEQRKKISERMKQYNASKHTV